MNREFESNGFGLKLVEIEENSDMHYYVTSVTPSADPNKTLKGTVTRKEFPSLEEAERHFKTERERILHLVACVENGSSFKLQRHPDKEEWDCQVKGVTQWKHGTSPLDALSNCIGTPLQNFLTQTLPGSDEVPFVLHIDIGGWYNKGNFMSSLEEEGENLCRELSFSCDCVVFQCEDYTDHDPKFCLWFKKTELN